MRYYTGLLPGPVIRKVPIERETVVQSYYVESRKVFYLFKRVFDISFSLVFIIGVLSWLTPIIALLTFLESKGPVFFVQLRAGRNGRLFRCLKFRTMIVNPEANELQAVKDDGRVTKLGRFLRKTNIDEFPQFFNILVGDMSVIGPRPHMLSDCTRFSFVIPSYKFRSQVRPGITGLAQVKGQHGPTLNYESIFMRFHWDAEYIRKAGFLLDLKILTFTFFRALINLIEI